jgi:uncharacterized protein (DUF362 family)
MNDLKKNRKHQPRNDADAGVVYTCDFSDWQSAVARLLDKSRLPERLRDVGQILIKPNLVEPQPPPVTTPVALVAAVVDYLQQHVPLARIIIGEGCGSQTHDTHAVFQKLGYVEMAEARDIELVDLNEAELVTKHLPQCRRLPEIHLPRLVFESFLLSMPVLKAHSLAGVTLTMKNMMGLAPPAYYEQGGAWKKASLHVGIQEAIADLNRYRTADFTLLDATIGMSRAHLWGPTCDPPPNRLIAGYDPVALDAHGTEILGRDWRRIGHIAAAHGELGTAEPLRVVGC